MSFRIRLSKSVIGTEEAEAVSRIILDDGYLGMGREVQLFEDELAKFLNVGRDKVISVNSGTAALHLAVQGVTSPGDEVLVQSLTYVASFQAITAAGCVPVACDVCPGTVTIDLDDAERKLTHKTKAIMPVHYASNPGNLDAVYSFAKLHGLRVIEDAAHAFGCTYKEKKIGSFGDIICFSFDGIKNITSGEGGAVITADFEIAGHIRDARLLGVEKDTRKRFTGRRSWDFDVEDQGYRYHMSNIFAAIGRVQLGRFSNEFAPKRVALAQRYRANLADISGICFLDIKLGPIVPHIQPIRVMNGLRDELRAYLNGAGIETGIHYKPNHLLTYYGGGKTALPLTERLYDQLLSLPLHPALTIDEVDRICSVIRHFVR